MPIKPWPAVTALAVVAVFAACTRLDLPHRRIALTLGVVGLVIGLLALTRYPTDLVMLGGLTILLTLRVLTPRQALEGFANPAVITYGVLFVVCAGLRETGAMAMLTRPVLGRPRTVAAAQLRMMLPLTALSAFIYNTPLTAMMLPVVSDWAKRIQVAASKLMIPLSYAIMLGGMLTLVGSSTNLVVSGLVEAHFREVARERAAAGAAQAAAVPFQDGLRLFDQTWIALPCAAVGLLYLIFIGRKYLPERQKILSLEDDVRQYTVEMVVDPGSSLVGKTVEQAGLRGLPGLYLVEIDRAGRILPAVGPRERLQGDDRLVFAGVLESVVDLQKTRDLRPAGNQTAKLDIPRSQRCLIEAVVSHTCPLVGQSVREGRFRSVYDAAIVAVARSGERVREKIGDIVLRAGDTLLLESDPGFIERRRNSRDFYLVSRVEEASLPRYERAWLAVVILAGMVLVAGVGWLSMVNAAMLAAGLMLVTHCCSVDDARQSIHWPVLLVIAASLGIGRAAQVSGAAEAVARRFISLAGTNPWVLLVAVYGVTLVLSELMSHIAAVAVVLPIALLTAEGLGARPHAYVMSVLIAASSTFAVPIGSPTNLMVYGPGGYRFHDFVKLGLPLDLLLMAVTVLLAPLIWPFHVP